MLALSKLELERHNMTSPASVGAVSDLLLLLLLCQTCSFE